MSKEILNAGVEFLATVLQEEIRKQNERKKRKWVRKWIERRDKYGASANLLRELSVEDPSAYRNIMRMTSEKFDMLLEMVEDKIRKENTVMRMAILPRTKLEVTLRYLATGDSFKTLEYLFRIPQCSISKFLPEVLDAISEVLKQYIQVPDKKEEWIQIANSFQHRWNFPGCCGAIDGKHVHIKCPPRSGSTFFNYKGTFSVILFALVDADYCFRYLDVGGNGRASDSAIFRDSTLNIAMQNNLLDMPEKSVILGDDAFPLRTNLMKPYSRTGLSDSEKIFNYRLSRARRVVENAFGILVWRFRIFLRPIDLKISTIDKLIWAACSLHNWLRMTSPNYFQPHHVDQEDLNTAVDIPGGWREYTAGLQSVAHLGSNNYQREAENVRRTYTDYFMKEGSLPWQWIKVGVNEPL